MGQLAVDSAARPAADQPVMFARQAIFDRRLNVVAFELLFRQLAGDGPSVVDGDVKTSHLILDTLGTWGVAALTGRRPAYINFTRWVLMGDLPAMLRPEHVVVEIVEDVEPDEAVLSACRRLRRRGFRIALDDVVDPGRVFAFAGAIDAAKVDFGAVSPNARAGLVRELQHASNIELVAEKIETHADFRQAVDLGFAKFQGFFLDRPELITHRRVSGFRSHYLRLVQALARGEVDLDEVEAAVRADFSLAHKLLRYANSALSGQLTRVQSLRQALVLLGEASIRRAAFLLTVTDLGRGRPEQLAVDCAVRARFAESLLKAGLDLRPLDLFLVGMLSKLDAMLDSTMSAALLDLPLSDELLSALTHRAGPLGEVLSFIEAYEHADWPAVDRVIARLGLDGERIPHLYAEALHWAAAAFALTAPAGDTERA